MLLDTYGTPITLANVPNEHILCTGKSGTGKTYYLCNHIEETFKQGKRILVLDFSGSFTHSELVRADYMCFDHTEFINLEKDGVYFPILHKEEGEEEKLVDFLVGVFGFRGYLQKQILRKAVSVLMNREEPKLKDILYILEQEAKLEEAKENNEQKRRIIKILDELDSVISRRVIDFWNDDGELRVLNKAPVTIVQMNCFSDSLKRYFVKAFLWMVWKTVQAKEKISERIILDEAQHLNFHDDVTSALLREGRKFGLGLTISTQFLDASNPIDLRTVLQAGSHLYFQPADADLAKVAAFIELENKNAWLRVLKELNVGEAVLVGHYRINANENIRYEPIVIRVKK